MEQPFAPWARDPEQIKTEAGDRLVKRQVLTESFKTVKLKNVFPPIHFESGVAKIPDNYGQPVSGGISAGCSRTCLAGFVQKEGELQNFVSKLAQ